MSDQGSIHQQIQEHPGRLANDRWTSLHRVHRLLIVNQAELLRLIDEFEQNERLAIEVMQNVRQTGVGEAFQDELLRTSHNYLSALKMLVDHTRNHMRAYEGTDVGIEYQRRASELASRGRTRLMQKLRDYFLHFQLPPFGTQIRWTPNEMRSVVYLSRDAALQFEDWPAPARIYLSEQEEHISLRELVEGYSNDIDALYTWLYERYTDLHGHEIDDLNELIVRAQGGANTPGHPDYVEPINRPQADS